MSRGYVTDSATSAAVQDRKYFTAICLSEESPTISSASLEDNPLFNCGYGSNPTMDGSVECEAGFMSSDGLRFGGVGVVSRLKNPSKVAKAIAYADNSSGLVSPMVLVGSGAEKWAEKKGFILNDPNALSGVKTEEIWKKALDATGKEDMAEACTSSGGLVLKSPGRLGHCTIFGSGLWAEKRGSTCIGVTVSGCGEAIVRADFCRSLSKRLFSRYATK
uniref:L-asparaginase n=1 Tax=Angiostrongylus cantonensis TaxID=6313 RepID=A0A0K0CWT1_ANGCA